MTKLQRRLFMFSFILLFLIIAPAVILMAQGYRFDFKHGIFVYSGSVTTKSWPRSIDIYLDGELQDRGTLNAVNSSYTINGLRPGRYHLKSARDGYTSWEKEIEVHSGISTEFWNMILYPKNNDQIETYDTFKVLQYFLSPREENEIVFFTEKGDQKIISLLNTKTNIPEEIYSTSEFDFIDPDEKENVEWSSGNKRILIPFQEDGKKVYIIARIRKENLRDIVNVHDLFKDYEPVSDAEDTHETLNTKVDFEKVRWMFNKNNELVVLTKNHELFYVNIDKPEEKFLINTQVSGFDFAGNRIYYTQLQNNIVWEIKNNDPNTKKQITSLPIDTDPESFMKLIAYDQYRIAFITSDNDLYVYNHEKEKGETSMDHIISDINDVQFSDDGKKLLYWTTNEIWNLMLRKWEVQPLRKKNDRLFITRFSTPIHNVQWLDDYENILFSINGTVKTVELDTRDRVNIVDIRKIGEESIAERDLIYDKKNQLLYSRVKMNDIYQLQSSLLIDKTGLFGF